jgi:exodeoxyribonuclease VII large subunit
MPGFFDNFGDLSRRPAPAPANADAPLTPSSLNKLVESALKKGLPPSFVVRGEVSNFSRHRASGHIYFTLKDAQSTIDCVMFASRANTLRFDPEDGIDVLVTGSIGVYAPRGRYQVYASRIEPVGAGALELAKRQLEAKLRAEGLIDDERRRPLPAYPKTIALITSPQAAAYADVLKVLRRYPFLRLIVVPVPVQGAQAAAGIARGFALFNSVAKELSIDVALLIRGGGSLEDLWAFNEEAVARAVAGSAVPVVTGIGHETDVSIADLIADHHAHTPTEAATVVTGRWRSVVDFLDAGQSRLRNALRAVYQHADVRLRSIERHSIFRKPQSLLDPIRQRIDDLETLLDDRAQTRLDDLRDRLHDFAPRLAAQRPEMRLRMMQDRVARAGQRLEDAMRRRVERTKRSLDASESLLRVLGPQQVLARGYTITQHADGRVVRRADDLKPGDVITTRFADGATKSTVADAKQGLLFENVPKR